MGDLWLPDTARPATPAAPIDEVEYDTQTILEQLTDVSERLEYYNREARKIDEHLRIVLAKPGADLSLGLKPNYYHIVRIRPGHMAYVKPIENPDGTWRDLDSYVFTLIGEDDLWNDRLQREKRQKARRAEEARLRQKDREARERVEHFNERLKSATSTSISVPRGI